MPIYNKLVRDRIPEIIEKSGKKYSFRILEQEDYKLELQKKCREELDEYLQARNDQEAMEELADLLEMIYALVEVHDSSFEELEQIRREKAETRGGFQERLFLVGVDDDDI
ncbi:nucleoside triphosphate pyrophosphohydrolase [Ammoniphilus sp. CFH 90114]|uniref:nucleoside triphosphate pyrophosphohydrolase n=1 Tax=Ammoniphilus sp. CFH 90114 TaxID=2493665 RepID=UPI00100DF8E2|nr:nucleoside triphosphate pyrophosphohydrolase [Ammoniphilus sp. CFH 90114]RXT03735.1 phosphoribosyl-ATP pyrophosphohydrolase [Ammoniphilus sp. CFH 90114]